MAHSHQLELLRRVALSAVIAMASSGAALAQDASPANDRANRMAYETSIKCFVANGVLVGDQEQAGDKQKAALYDAKARQSFDLAGRFGEALGYSGSRINQDFGLVQARELPKLVKDRDYFKTTAATCKALGLM